MRDPPYDLLISRKAMNFGKGHRYIVCSNQIPVEIPHAKLRPGGGGGAWAQSPLKCSEVNDVRAELRVALLAGAPGPDQPSPSPHSEA